MAEVGGGHARSAGEAAEAKAYGLTPGDLRDWASFSPVEIYWAVRHDLTPAAARRWAREGLRVCDTVRAIALGMNPGQVRLWADAGFAPCDAVEATEMVVPLDAALAWREAGFILPDAALLIHDGWTLQEAVRARYEDVQFPPPPLRSSSSRRRYGRPVPAVAVTVVARRPASGRTPAASSAIEEVFGVSVVLGHVAGSVGCLAPVRCGPPPPEANRLLLTPGGYAFHDHGSVGAVCGPFDP